MLRFSKSGGKYELSMQMKHQQLVYPREDSFFIYIMSWEKKVGLGIGWGDVLLVGKEKKEKYLCSSTSQRKPTSNIYWKVFLKSCLPMNDFQLGRIEPSWALIRELKQLSRDSCLRTIATFPLLFCFGYQFQVN